MIHVVALECYFTSIQFTLCIQTLHQRLSMFRSCQLDYVFDILVMDSLSRLLNTLFLFSYLTRKNSWRKWYLELLFGALENQKKSHPWWHSFVYLLLHTSLGRLLLLTEGLVSTVSRVLCECSNKRNKRQKINSIHLILIVHYAIRF